MSENKLDDLPEEIGDMESLTDLHLSMNLLERLPDTIGRSLASVRFAAGCKVTQWKLYPVGIIKRTGPSSGSRI